MFDDTIGFRELILPSAGEKSLRLLGLKARLPQQSRPRFHALPPLYGVLHYMPVAVEEKKNKKNHQLNKLGFARNMGP
jgi:hypothetical protein